jgi:hypothetical protein
MQDPDNIVHVVFDRSPKHRVKPHARKFWGLGKEQFLFWTMICYMVALVGALVAAGLYLLS